MRLARLQWRMEIEKKREVTMNPSKTNHYMLAYPEKSARKASLWEWVSMLTIGVAFIGIAAIYIQT